MRDIKFYNRASVALLITSIVGLGATIFVTAKQAPKAKEKLDKKKEEKGENLTPKEIIKTVAVEYIPVAITAVATIGCMSGTIGVSKKAQTSLSGALALTGSLFNKYQNVVKETFGENEHQKIIDRIVKEDVKEDLVITAPCMFTNTTLDFDCKDETRHLFYDYFSDRYFETTFSRVLQAEYHLNRTFVGGGRATPNLFYNFLGLSAIDTDKLVWERDILSLTEIYFEFLFLNKKNLY